MVANGVTVQDGASLINRGGVIHVTAVGESEATVEIASGSTDSPAGGAIAVRGYSSLDVNRNLTDPDTQP